jgi:hypothetical protein
MTTIRSLMHSSDFSRVSLFAVRLVLTAPSFVGGDVIDLLACVCLALSCRFLVVSHICYFTYVTRILCPSRISCLWCFPIISHTLSFVCLSLFRKSVCTSTFVMDLCGEQNTLTCSHFRQHLLSTLSIHFHNLFYSLCPLQASNKSNSEHWSLTFWSPYWGGTLLFRPACCVVLLCGKRTSSSSS